MLTLFLVFVGSALGGVLRFALSGIVARRLDGHFPAGTMFVNVSGAFAIGLVWAWPGLLNDPLWVLRDFLMLGLLGGYTTVSTFSLNVMSLLQENKQLLAAVDFVGSWAACLVAVFAGAFLGGGGW